MEEGEDQAETASSSSAPAPLPEAVVKIESKDPAAEGEGDDDDVIEVGMLKEYYDQDVQINGRGPMYRVTLVMVGSPISYPTEEDDWCNLPFESLRALDSATLAFVRSVMLIRRSSSMALCALCGTLYTAFTSFTSSLIFSPM